MKRRLYQLIVSVVALLAFVCPTCASSVEDANKALPEMVGSYRRVSAPQLNDQSSDTRGFSARADYSAPAGGRITVNLYLAEQDGRAYEMLSTAARNLGNDALSRATTRRPPKTVNPCTRLYLVAFMHSISSNIAR